MAHRYEAGPTGILYVLSNEENRELAEFIQMQYTFGNVSISKIDAWASLLLGENGNTEYNV